MEMLISSSQSYSLCWQSTCMLLQANARLFVWRQEFVPSLIYTHFHCILMQAFFVYSQFSAVTASGVPSQQ